METYVDFIIELIFGFLGANKESLKDVFISNGYAHLWDFFRDYVFSYKVWILGLAPALIIERLIPAVGRKSIIDKNLIFDSAYPIFVTLIALPYTVLVIALVQELYAEYIPIVNLRILDDKPLIIQCVGAFLISDFMLYFSHYLRHKVKWFWYFHAIHHSQEHMNPMTTHRGHFFGGVINVLIRTLPIGIVGGSLPAWGLYMVINNFWGYFIHSNTRTNLGPLKWIIVSPQFHRVHHSVETEHFDRNYGERLILWDWLFGTIVKDFNVYPNTGVKGIERWVIEKNSNPIEICRAWTAQAVYPMVKIYQSIASLRPRPSASCDKST